MTAQQPSQQQPGTGARRQGRRDILLAASALTLVLTGALLTTINSARAAVGCKVNYQVVSQWGRGFVASVAVTSLGDGLDGWTLEWTMADGQRVFSAWNAAVTTNGTHATAKNMPYNAAVASGGTVSFGFLGTWKASNPVPSTFSLNGTVCDGTGNTPAPTTSTTPAEETPVAGTPSTGTPTEGTPTEGTPTPETSTAPATNDDAADEKAHFVAPNGSDSAAGTKAAPWATIAHAQAAVGAGDTVYFRGGTYAYSAGVNNCRSQTDVVNAITLSKSGSSGNPIRYSAYPGETPTFDFSRMTNDCRIKGLNVTGNWIHIKGLEVTGVRQNNNKNHESWGMWVSGSNNTFERIDAHHIMGAGLFIANGSGNLVLNSDSHDNYDPRSSNGAGENADGFGAHVPANRSGNVFRGCRAWWNADDGYDLINAFSAVTIENSWAWRNGYKSGTTTPAGNGNGFKAGGYGGGFRSDAAKHTVRSSVAFANRASGFYANHHPRANDFFNNTSYGNHPDFNMLGVNSRGAAVSLGTLRNNIAYKGTLLSNMSGADAAFNSWNLGITLSDAQFQSVSTSGWDAPRQADGNLPVLPGFRLAANSSLIDKGVDVGLPYHGSAPDLGAFES